MSQKRAFTMVELIFVIVILGILAAVAVPKLNASRQDAKIATAVADMRTFWSDLHSYWALEGFIEEDLDLDEITNVPLEEDGWDWVYYVDDKPCIEITAKEDNEVDFAIADESTDVCERAIARMDFLRGYQFGYFDARRSPEEAAAMGIVVSDEKVTLNDAELGIEVLFESGINFD